MGQQTTVTLQNSKYATDLHVVLGFNLKVKTKS